jgi:hypothetical protein
MIGILIIDISRYSFNFFLFLLLKKKQLLTQTVFKALPLFLSNKLFFFQLFIKNCIFQSYESGSDIYLVVYKLNSNFKTIT